MKLLKNRGAIAPPATPSPTALQKKEPIAQIFLLFPIKMSIMAVWLFFFWESDFCLFSWTSAITWTWTIRFREISVILIQFVSGVGSYSKNDGQKSFLHSCWKIPSHTVAIIGCSVPQNWLLLILLLNWNIDSQLWNRSH